MKISRIIAAFAILASCVANAHAHDCAPGVVGKPDSDGGFYRVACQEHVLRKGGRVTKVFWRSSEGLLCGAYDEGADTIPATWRLIPLYDPSESPVVEFRTAAGTHAFWSFTRDPRLAGRWLILEVEFAGPPRARWRTLIKWADGYMGRPYCPQYLIEIDPWDLGAHERLAHFDETRYAAP